MEVVIAEQRELTGLAADAVERLVREEPSAVLGLATGSTPMPVYDELVRRHREEGLSFAGARGFLLDEYVGLCRDHPQRYRRVISQEIVERVDWPEEQVLGPDGLAEDLPEACACYEQSIAEAGGIDLQLLGIGADGHVAFNEPGSSLASRTRVKSLTAQTREDNARFFDSPEEVPVHCLTQGLGTISEARHLVLLAIGEHKAPAVRQLVEGAISARWPATVLQLHPHVTVLVDEAAASGLELSDYYRQAFASKPEGQGI